MSYMNDGCDPFGIPYIEYENKKTVKKERDKPIERFTYNGCIIFDRDNRMEVWETVNFLNELVKENEQLQTRNNAYIQDIEVFKEENTHLKIENEELKDFAQHNYSETKKIINNLQKENEQLKEALTELKEIGDYQAMRINELSDENEQLKKENKKLADALTVYFENKTKKGL